MRDHLQDGSSFDIEIHEPEQDSTEVTGVAVTLKDDVLESIWQHAVGGHRREVAGALVGRVAPGRVFVDAHIEARDGPANATSVTITHSDWDSFHRELHNYPGCGIVGWYHSHPGHGIFLSRSDTFIHEAFFTGREQIALVVDHIQNKYDVFCWEHGDLVIAPDVQVIGPNAAEWSDGSRRQKSTARKTPSFAQLLQAKERQIHRADEVEVLSLQIDVQLNPYYLHPSREDERDALLVSWLQHNSLSKLYKPIEVRLFGDDRANPKVLLRYRKGELIQIQPYPMSKRGTNIDERV